MISEGTVGIRRFGRNDELVPCDCRGTTVFANGNNINIVGDLVRRTLTSHQNAKTDKPEERVFEFDPIDLVKRDRGKYLAAIFTIVRAYIEAGCPMKEGVKPLNGFDGWSKMVRYPLIWAGLVYPVESTNEARARDPKRIAFRLLIEALLNAFGTNEFTSKEILNKIQQMIPSTVGGYYQQTPQYPDLLEAFAVEGKGRQITAISIGARLKKEEGRITNGYHIEIVREDPKLSHVYKLVGEKREPEVVAAAPSAEREM